MDNIQAEDIMIALDSYPHVPYWFSLRQAIVEMEKAQLEVDGRKSLPRVVLVFDEQYRLMGIVRRRDILRGLGPNAMQESKERAGETDPRIKRDLRAPDAAGRASIEDIRRRAERPVNEVMTPIRVTLASDTPLMDVANTMVVHNVSIIPILKDGAVVGVVRSTDVLHRIDKEIMRDSTAKTDTSE
jgi:CBS domain-containing protein